MSRKVSEQEKIEAQKQIMIAAQTEEYIRQLKKGMTWQDLQHWAVDKGIDTGKNSITIDVKNSNLEVIFLECGSICIREWGNHDIKLIFENRTAEQIKTIIENLIIDNS